MQLLFAFLPVAGAAEPEAMNLRIVGRSDLRGRGNGGEGLALREYEGGRRILFLAHESAPVCFSVVDVTDVRSPNVLTQVSPMRRARALSPSFRRPGISRSSASAEVVSGPTIST